MHPLNKKVKFMKDSIDFGSMEIPKLFRKLLIPTVLGMVFSAVFVDNRWYFCRSRDR